ncbi:hypothetical protein ABPG77_002565 [Micractinium sp. CCAP 211/92]
MPLAGRLCGLPCSASRYVQGWAAAPPPCTPASLVALPCLPLLLRGGTCRSLVAAQPGNPSAALCVRALPCHACLPCPPHWAALLAPTLRGDTPSQAAPGPIDCVSPLLSAPACCALPSVQSACSPGNLAPHPSTGILRSPAM